MLISILVGTEDTSEIFYEDGISFIPLRSWGREGKTECHRLFFFACCSRWIRKLKKVKIQNRLQHNDISNVRKLNTTLILK